MPEQTITIGGKQFEVSCQEGEEDYLRAAAALLDTQARALAQQPAQLSNSRMLLMAGLVLADRSVHLEEELRDLRARLSEAETSLEALRARPERVEVPVIPSDLTTRLAKIAEQAERVAARTEQAGATTG